MNDKNLALEIPNLKSTAYMTVKLAKKSDVAMPWQERPIGNTDTIWRYEHNPLIGRNHFKGAAGIYNSAVYQTDLGFVGIFRVDSNTGMPFLHLGKSADGIKWRIEEQRISFTAMPGMPGVNEFAYDPRLCKIDDTYYITWCNGYHGPTIGIASTKDFKTFQQIENAFLPFNRNGVLFPRKINGKFAMLSRPSDNGHTPFGDIFYSESPDLMYWGKHRFVIGPTQLWWESKKVGAGPVPIETEQGWLLFYHGVMSTCNGFVYSMGATLLDLEQPWCVRHRSKSYMLGPQMPYEVNGLVPNVVFPCAALHDRKTGRLAIYYGGADTYTCLAFAYIDEIIDFIRSH